MDLPAFIRSRGETVDEACIAAGKLFGVSPSTAKGWLYRNRYPRPKQAPDVIARTEGKVRWSGIYAPKSS